MIRLYLDENVRGGLYKGLLRRGVDVVSAQEDGFDNTPDPEVLTRATELGRTLFTHDDDLLIEAHKRQMEGISFAGVIFAQQNSLSIGRTIDDLALIAELCDEEEFASFVQYLPL